MTSINSRLRKSRFVYESEKDDQLVSLLHALHLILVSAPISSKYRLRHQYAIYGPSRHLFRDILHSGNATLLLCSLTSFMSCKNFPAKSPLANFYYAHKKHIFPSASFAITVRWRGIIVVHLSGTMHFLLANFLLALKETRCLLDHQFWAQGFNLTPDWKTSLRYICGRNCDDLSIGLDRTFLKARLTSFDKLQLKLGSLSQQN